MSKRNYSAILLSNQILGKIGQKVTLKKGYAKFLYQQGKILHNIRNSNLQQKVTKEIQHIMELVKTIPQITIYKKNKSSDLKKQLITKFTLRKIISKQINKNVNFLDILLPNISDYGQYIAEIYHTNKLIHSLEIQIINKSQNA